MSDTPRSDARERETEYCLIYTHWHCGWTMSRTLERELAAVTAERDALLAVVNTLAEKRWFLDKVGAECTFEGAPMVQIGHLEDLVEMAENALCGKGGA